MSILRTITVISVVLYLGLFSVASVFAGDYYPTTLGYCPTPVGDPVSAPIYNCPWTPPTNIQTGPGPSVANYPMAQNYPVQSNSPAPYYYQVASVASAVQPVTQAVTPQLPKTGGGGKSMTAGADTGNSHYNYGLLVSGGVLVLISGVFAFFILKKPSESQFEMSS